MSKGPNTYYGILGGFPLTKPDRPRGWRPRTATRRRNRTLALAIPRRHGSR